MWSQRLHFLRSYALPTNIGDEYRNQKQKATNEQQQQKKKKERERENTEIDRVSK